MIKREMPQLMKAVLTVKEKTYLTPHYIRIILEDDNMDIFAASRIGDNNKIVLPGADGVVRIPDFQANGAGFPAERPLIRTYTMRDLDLQNNLMTIDFVAHGDEGSASGWAIRAKPGDQLGVLMKVKSKPHFNQAQFNVIAGDHTALPVISVILENLSEDVKGVAVIEVYGPEDVLELKKPEGIDLIWKFNQHPGQASELTSYFKRLALPAGQQPSIFVAAEYHAISEIQGIFKSSLSLDRQHWRTHAYWKHGQAEDASAEERRDVQEQH